MSSEPQALAVNAAPFHPERLETFWYFISERQKIWYLRHAEQKEPPWTEDEVLQNYRFTNVYRILDPGTQYLVEEILSKDTDRMQRLFDATIYRILGRRETHEKLGSALEPPFSQSSLEERLRSIKHKASHPVFTGAYTVAPYHQYGGGDKIENVSLLAGQIRADLPQVLADIEKAGELKRVYEALKRLPGLGRFLAYQVSVDLTYTLEDGDSFLPLSQDEWTVPGPGAQRGLEILRTSGETENLELIQLLRDHQAKEFERLGLDFKPLKRQNSTPRWLSLADIQNCLCEFSKYWKIRQNPASARRRFRGEKAQNSPFHVNDVQGWCVE